MTPELVPPTDFARWANQRYARLAPCPALFVKIFRYARRANHLYNSRHPGPQEGRWPSSRTLGREAVDAAALARNGIAGQAQACERSGRADERCCGGRQKRVVVAPVGGVKAAGGFEPHRVRRTFKPATTGARR